MKNMGAKMPEEEMQPLVDAWRAANPHIVGLWNAMDRAMRKVIRDHTAVRVGKIRLYWKDEKMLIRLPSGRELCFGDDLKVTNFEMEGSAIAGIAAHLGHNAGTVCCIIAHRHHKASNPDYKAQVRKLVELSLDKMAQLK